MWAYLFALLGVVLWPTAADYTLSARTGALPFFLYLSSGNRTVVINDGVLAGNSNASLTTLSTDAYNVITNNDTSGSIHSQLITPTVARIEVNTSSNYVGAKFIIAKDEKIFGLWEYPWRGSLLNTNVSFDLKGVGNAPGINWSNARAPFFLSTYGYGVYTDTLQMGSYDFKAPFHGQFIFNTSSLVYYIILPEGSPTNFKSILSQYTKLSARIEMPPDSAFGPTFWSDDFEQDFHNGVSNAEENIHDVVQYLHVNKIHATSLFDDRPYGTGNSSWGNFDFDPKFYPDPPGMVEEFQKIGYDFQVWAANRTFYQTSMFKTGSKNGWLFPGIDGVKFQGPAFDLKIPAAYSWLSDKLSYFPKIGVKGFKIDRGEEEEMPVWEQNQQMSIFIKLLYDVMAKKWGKSRFYNFARSAVDRSRAHTGIWNGDAHADWQGLRYTVASGIRAGLLGFSMWGSDTGGYNRQPNYNLTTELWARWMWFSTFSPVYEIMVGTGNTPWYPPYSPKAATELSKISSPLMDILKQTTKMHHQLRPYIKSHTYKATQNGVPLLRALILEAPNDPKGYEIPDQYFFGDAFLVAPIVAAGGRRAVYFPDKGARYIDYFDKNLSYTGGTAVDIQVPLTRAPVYVRMGSIIPIGDTYKGNNNWTQNWKPKVQVEFFPSFDVPMSIFMYWNGTHQVMLKMETFGVEGGVGIEYGNLGIDAELIVWTKKGGMRAEMVRGGGTVTFEGVESLF